MFNTKKSCKCVKLKIHKIIFNFYILLTNYFTVSLLKKVKCITIYEGVKNKKSKVLSDFQKNRKIVKTHFYYYTNNFYKKKVPEQSHPYYHNVNV